jgi:putative tricarboxylic transport membrane protein
MRCNDAVSGILIIVLSMVLFANTLSFPEVSGFQYGAGVFPRAVLSILFLCGVSLTVKGARSLKVTGIVHLDSWARQPKSWLMFVLIVLGMLLYVLLSEVLGFVPVCTVIIFVLLMASGGRRHLLSSILLAVAFPAALQLVFVNALRVPLPRGVFASFF